MGVSGLLPCLKDIQKTTALAQYSDKTVAVDGYAWLHRVAYSCAHELVNDMPTDKYVNFFRRRVAMFRNMQVEPYIVFDGDMFGSKMATEKKREDSRAANKLQGNMYWKQGNRSKAMQCFVSAIDVTPAMAKSVIDYLRSAGVKYVVAPYEADSQMVYLEKIGLVDAIVSEDSDLLVFGCKTLLTKFDERAMTFQLVKQSDFVHNSFMRTLSAAQFMYVACLSGCDYTNGIPKVGIKRAFQLCKHCDAFSSVLAKVRLAKYKVPPQFEEEASRAMLSFRFARVFDPRSDSMSTLSPIPNNLSEYEKSVLEQCIGAFIGEELHRAIAHGDVDPITKSPLISRELTFNRSSGTFAAATGPKSAQKSASVTNQKSKHNGIMEMLKKAGKGASKPKNGPIASKVFKPVLRKSSSSSSINNVISNNVQKKMGMFQRRTPATSTSPYFWSNSESQSQSKSKPKSEPQQETINVSDGEISDFESDKENLVIADESTCSVDQSFSSISQSLGLTLNESIAEMESFENELSDHEVEEVEEVDEPKAIKAVTVVKSTAVWGSLYEKYAYK